MSQSDGGTDNGSGAPKRAPKVIVVCSDGTGNSAAKLLRTNVWRLFQALDLTEPTPEKAAQGVRRQIAVYDDGVGTSAFKPLALLGGVFGWGLKRNVLDLYTFLCRNYRPGDQIYAFGFSRGAFTIRILVGLLAQEGLLRCAPGCTEEELARHAPDAYRAYRRSFTHAGPHVTLLRNLRDDAITAWRRIWRHKTYDEIEKRLPEGIAFVGVWDTVAAYGLPLAELTHGIDKWVWPLSMPDYKLSERVGKARHALALDDERDTFHPLVWDELAERELITQRKVDADRLQQVWFAGMHSDVGGGYADDGLAHVALEWMMREAAAAGLHFNPQRVEELKPAWNEFGPLHDSRRGIGGYYRYQPRKIGALLDPPEPSTLIMRNPKLNGRGLLKGVKIHECVLDRIGSGPDHYAPIVLPRDYQVVRRDRTIADSPESPEDAQARVAGQEAVWNEVWKKRIAYFATVGVSLALAALPLIHAIWPPPACAGPQCLVTPVIAGAGDFLPGFVQPWITAFERSPGLFLAAVVAIAVLLATSASLQRRIQDRMRLLWGRSLRLGEALVPATAAGREPGGWIYRLRTHQAYQGMFRFLKWRLGPGVFGLGTLAIALLLIVALPWVTVGRVQLVAAERSNAICQIDNGSPEAEPEAFLTKSLCWSTRTRVEEGQRYRVSLTVPEPWVDASIPADPIGFGSEKLPWYARYTAAPLRRSLSDRWFQPMVKIMPPENSSSRVEALEMRVEANRYTAEFVAARTGEVFLFVNDGILPWPGSSKWFYDNNKGTATVQIERIDEVPEPEIATRDAD